MKHYLVSQVDETRERILRTFGENKEFGTRALHQRLITRSDDLKWKDSDDPWRLLDELGHLLISGMTSKERT